MPADTPKAEELAHHAAPMAGRNPHERHRSVTPLELLFDLTFVIAFGQAAAQFAHALSQAHYAAALIGFSFAGFAICWSWINFSWFASAYDTDDWIFRLVTMLQMIGVLILAIGLPRMFASVGEGRHLDNSIMVLGYVVMRIGLISQWLRAARQDPQRRRACLSYAAAVSLAQFGWLVLIFVDFSLPVAFGLGLLMVVVEMIGPYLAERRDGGTPWHAHHIAERYSLFAIIALGEGVVGTVATLSAGVQKDGWTLDIALLAVAGTGLTFGMWWIYYLLPSAHILQAHRERAFVWGYSQIVIVAAIVATGAGLHVAAEFLARTAKIGALATVLCVAVPLGLFIGAIHTLYAYLLRDFQQAQVWLLLVTAAVMAASVAAAAAGLNMSVCLVILVFAPVVTVVGFEWRGHRRQAQMLERQTPLQQP